MTCEAECGSCVYYEDSQEKTAKFGNIQNDFLFLVLLKDLMSSQTDLVLHCSLGSAGWLQISKHVDLK